jgi:hypothetical protein
VAYCQWVYGGGAVSPGRFERSFIVRLREGQQKNVHYKKKQKKKKKSHAIVNKTTACV